MLEEDLLRFRRKLNVELESNDFTGRCWDVAKIVSNIFPLDFVCGFYLDGPARYEHAWNYDPETGLFYDLTAEQFDVNNGKLLVSSSNDSRYEIVDY